MAVYTVSLMLNMIFHFLGVVLVNLPALKRPRQENYRFEACLGNIGVRACCEKGARKIG